MIETIEKVVQQALTIAGYSLETPRIIPSNRPDLCDYQCDDIFKLAKIYKESPLIIGEKIIAALEKQEESKFYFQQVQLIAPGFLNFKLSDQFINEQLNQMLNQPKFAMKMPEPELYFLDYGGPNIAKPLHVGHFRSAVVGEAINRILKYANQTTISDVHLGDYGLQIGQVIYGILEDQKKEEEITLAYLEELYPKISGKCKEDEQIKTICEQITKDLQDGNPKYQHLWKIILEVSGNDIKRLYHYLDIHFDLWKGESDAYPYIKGLQEELEEKQLLLASDGAQVIPVSEATDPKEIPPLIFQKSNGAYLYGTTDLATIKERQETYAPDHYIYIVDLRQSLHFEQVFRVTKKAALAPKATFEFCGFGTINGMDGKPFKTRKGDAPKLDSLFAQVKEIFIAKKQENQTMSEENIDKIVNAILKFADLQNNRERNYIFDLAKFSEVIGKTGPYILYTSVRIKKLLTEVPATSFKTAIYNETDRILRMKLLELPLAFQSSLKERMPHYLADYVYELCVTANNFYQNNRLNELEDHEKKQQWLLLLTLTNQVLIEMLHLLVMEVPTEM